MITITTALLGLTALTAATPVEDIAAQFGTETQATNISCATYDVAYCYGVGPDGTVIGMTFADGAFTPIGAAAVAGGATTIAEGTWLVGSDIAPGTYRTQTEGDGIFDSCYWARLSDLSGELDAIIANENVSGQGLVTIEASDFAFETGCTWTPA